MAMRRYSNLLLNRCRRLRPCVEVWKMFYTLMYLIWRPIPSVKTTVVSGSLIDEEEQQIIGTLSDECFNLILNYINLFYRSKLLDTCIHRKEELRKLRIVEMRKFFEVFVSFVFHRRIIPCKPTIHSPKSALSSLRACSFS